MKRLVLLFGLLSFALLVSGCGKSVERGYYNYWLEDHHLGMVRTFVKHKIRHCGQVKYRPAKHSKSEFVAACTRDGEKWFYYLVLTSSEDLVGPFDSEEKLLEVIL